MRSLNQKELLAVSGAGTCAKADMIAALKAKLASKKKKKTCTPKPACPTTPPEKEEGEIPEGLG